MDVVILVFCFVSVALSIDLCIGAEMCNFVSNDGVIKVILGVIQWIQNKTVYSVFVKIAMK